MIICPLKQPVFALSRSANQRIDQFEPERPSGRRPAAWPGARACEMTFALRQQ
jgi:hypothetical protein